jgi:hypothetical protein
MIIPSRPAIHIDSFGWGSWGFPLPQLMQSAMSYFNALIGQHLPSGAIVFRIYFYSGLWAQTRLEVRVYPSPAGDCSWSRFNSCKSVWAKSRLDSTQLFDTTQLSKGSIIPRVPHFTYLHASTPTRKPNEPSPPFFYFPTILKKLSLNLPSLPTLVRSRAHQRNLRQAWPPRSTPSPADRFSSSPFPLPLPMSAGCLPSFIQTSRGTP